MALGIILLMLVFFIVGFIIMVSANIDWESFWAKRKKPSPIKLTSKAIDPPFETIKDVFDAKLEAPPLGCLWEIEKVTKAFVKAEVYSSGFKKTQQVIESSHPKFNDFRSKYPVQQHTYARIRLVSPSGKFRLYEDILLPKDRVGFIELGIKVRNSSQKIVNEYNLENGDWDGVYIKDVL
jgi:hypothetical protein